MKDAGVLTGDNAVSTAASLPCDIDAILTKNCAGCHSDPPQFTAPMPLRTLADLHADAPSSPGKKVYQAVGERIHDDLSPMPEPPKPRLSAADTATLDAWIAAGAPPGASACSDAGPGSSGEIPELPCNADQHVRPASKYTVPLTTDQYVCYGFDTNAAEKRHVIALGPHIDNRRVVHHVLLYQTDQPVSSTPYPCAPAAALSWRLVTGWAPGGENIMLPAEAGFPEEVGTTHWAMQIHYNNALALTDQDDETGFDFCTTTNLRRYDADVLATGTEYIHIPPRSKHTIACDYPVPAAFANINVFMSSPHMHRLGRAESASRIRNGVSTPILDVPNFEFSVGAGQHPVDVDLAAGDTVRTTCSWTNSGDTMIEFGEKTGNEMCFAFMLYYPKIKTPFSWVLPALFSHCTSTTE